MKSFNSFRDYLRFTVAKQFVYKESGQPFEYRRSRLEKTGGVIASLIFRPGDYLLKNIRNPLFITAAVVVGIALTTLVFYPALFPVFLSAGTLKLGAFLLTESTLVGLCLRTLGRLNNQELMLAWIKKELDPIAPGSIIVAKGKNYEAK